MVEYILLCVVVIGLVLAAKNMFDALDKGIDNYVGGYFTCLMEYGELPSLGVKNSELKKHISGSGKKCEAKFEEFSIASGRPPVGAGGSGGRSGSARGGSDAEGRSGEGEGANRNQSEAEEAAGENDALSSVRKGGGSGGSNRRELRGNSGYNAYSTADNPINEGAPKIRILEEEDEANNQRGGNRRLGGSFSRPEPYRAITGRMKKELQKQQKRKPTARTPTKTVKKLTDEEKTRVTIKKNIERSLASNEIKQKSNTDGFTFGNLLRWLLIGGMVIAIVIFFGGQIMNYSNSKD